MEKTMREICKERMGKKLYAKIEFDDLIYYIKRDKFIKLMKKEGVDTREFIWYSDFVVDKKSDSILKCRWSMEDLLDGSVLKM